MTTDQEQREVAERVMSYIQHQSSKGPESIRDTIQKGHDQFMAALEGLTHEQATFKPGPEIWSVMQVLDHAVSAKQGTARLSSALARGETAERHGEDTPPLRSMEQAREEMDAAHEEVLAFVAAISPEVNLEARFDHPFFGALNCQEWAVFQRVHDGDHAQQIEQIKAAPGYPA